MIASEKELRHSITAVAKMDRIVEREAGEPLWDPETRAHIVDDTEATIRNIEREIAEYLTKKYGLVKERTE